MFCRNCGVQLPDDAFVCFRCGTGANPGLLLQQGKSRMAAGLLGVFLGGLGIHRFYLGYTGIGIAQIIVTLVTCGVGTLWGFIEGIVILAGGMNTDAEGRPLVP